MTSSARAERRRQARAARRNRVSGVFMDPDVDYGSTAGWCQSEDDLPEARQQAHDILIDLMGDTRTGGVIWVQKTGKEAHELLDQLSKGGAATQEVLDHYRRIRAHLREWGGWVVVALAPGEPTEGPD